MCLWDVTLRSNFQNIFCICRRTWKRNFLSSQCNEILILLIDILFSALLKKKSWPRIYWPVTSNGVMSFHQSTSFRICLNCKESFASGWHFPGQPTPQDWTRERCKYWAILAQDALMAILTWGIVRSTSQFNFLCPFLSLPTSFLSQV